MKNIIVSLLLLSSFLSEAQSMRKGFDIASIKSDTTYYYGITPKVTSEKEAYDLAIRSLYDNIADNCNPHAIYVGDDEPHKHLTDIVSTFEMSINERVKTHALVENFDDEEYSYIIYLTRKDFREICNERKESIKNLVMRGLDCEDGDSFRLEDALKSYYWAMMLCVAHPQGKTLKVNIDDEDVLIYDWLMERIDGSDGIFKSISILLPKDGAVQETPEGLLVTLNVRSTTGFPISNLQFQYNNGNKRMPTSVENGKATLLLGKDAKSKVNIRIEYEFEMESVVKPDVKLVLATFDEIPMKNNKKTIDLAQYMDDVVKEEDIQLGGFETANKKDGNLRRKIDKKFQINDTGYLGIMQEIESALRKKDYGSVRHHFTEEAFGMLDTLSRYGRMMVVGQQDYSFIKFGHQVICRDINMKFDFKNHVSFDRALIFRFNADTQKVESIAFKLSSDAEKDIVTKTKWSEEARLVLINFLEDYQTAYALKRHDYLKSIYSDDALVIVGHVLRDTVIPDRAEFKLSEKDVRLMTYDKDTYFKNLSRTFKLQEYINLRFADADFTRAFSSSGREVYGVRLLQEYYSTTYGDVGYLFLLVDLTDDNPLIHVRAWQPDKVDLESLMGMKDLRF